MPVTPELRATRQKRHNRRFAQAAAKVPHGVYCYSLSSGVTPITLSTGEQIQMPKRTLCPYWKRRSDWPDQMNGYCRLLKAGDNSPFKTHSGKRIATMLLHDQVKECGVNDAWDVDYEDDANEAA